MNIAYDQPLCDQPSVGVISPRNKSILLGSPLSQYSYDIQSVVPDGVGTYRNFPVGGAQITCCALSHDQTAFAYATNVMTIIDSKTGREKRSNLIHDLAVRGICQYNKNPYCWMSTSDDRTLRSWDTRDFPGEAKFPSKPSRSRAVCMSPDDNVVVVAGDTIMMYDVRTRRILSELAMNSPVIEMCVHSGEALLAVGCEDRIVSFWDMDTLECVSQSSALDSTVRRLEFIDTGSSATLRASGRPRAFLMLAATDCRLSTFGYEPFEMCSFVPMPEHNVTLDMRVDRSANTTTIAALGYATDRQCWSIQQIDLEALLSTQQRPVSPATTTASIADDCESISPVDTDELESPIYEGIKLVVPPKDDFQVTRVLTAPAAAALKPKLPRPLSRPRSATGTTQQPQMTHAEWMQQQTESRRPSRRIDSLKSKVTDGPQKPPKPVVQTTRARTTSKSKSSSALPRSSSKGAAVRRPSAHPPLHRRASRSPSGQATPASIMKEIMEGNAKMCALMDRRLKQSAALLRTLKARGIDEAIAEAIETGDNVLLGEMIQHLNANPKLWKLSLISRISSHLRQLLSDRNEVVVDAALAVLQTIITSFGDVLHSTSSMKPCDIGVNVAAEERQVRCIKCMEALRELRMNQSYLEERMAPLRRLKFSALMENFQNNIETLK